PAHADPAVEARARRVFGLQSDRCAEFKILAAAAARSTVEAGTGDRAITGSCLRYPKRRADVKLWPGNAAVAANPHVPGPGERAAFGCVVRDGVATKGPIDCEARVIRVIWRSCEHDRIPGRKGPGLASQCAPIRVARALLCHTSLAPFQSARPGNCYHDG